MYLLYGNQDNFLDSGETILTHQ